MRILMVNKDRDAAELKAELLRQSWTVDVADLRDEIVSVVQHCGPYDAIIIVARDASRQALPLLREMRCGGIRLPILVRVPQLAAENESALLNQGADDVLTGSTTASVLLARLQAATRRTLGHTSATLRCGNVELDQARRGVFVDGRSVRVTRREFDVLETLMLRRGAVLPKDLLMDRLYGDEDGPDQRILDVYICKLRRKLAAAGGAEIVRTVWGHGYALEEPSVAMIAAARARHAAGVPRRHRAHLAVDLGLAAAV
jgi:two-component system cell cycle response regulator CtrA